jgi:hypothetical protein
MKVEWLVPADRAEVVNGKLYLMGGGWDRLTVAEMPTQHPIALAVAFSVPWNDTNVRHRMAIRVLDEDATETLVEVGGNIEVGRPAGIAPGQTQRFQMAANLPLPLRRPGTHVIIASIEDEEVARTTFNVVHSPAPTLFVRPEDSPG